jgi:hypothetical protein
MVPLKVGEVTGSGPVTEASDDAPAGPVVTMRPGTATTAERRKAINAGRRRLI